MKALDNRPYAAYAKQPRNKRWLYWATFIWALGFAGAFLIIGFSPPGSVLNNSASGVGLAGIVSGLLGGLWFTRAGAYAAKTPPVPPLEHFLAQNHWPLSSGGQAADLPTELLALRAGEHIKKQFHGVYRGHKFVGTIAEYTLFTPAYKAEDWTPSLCIKMPLKQVFPFMAVKRRDDAGSLLTTPIGPTGKYGKRLELEGEFSSNYTVTILPDTEQDVLAFLTPDFMDELMGTLYDFSFEIGGRELFIYSNINSVVLGGTDTLVLHNLLGGLDVLLKQIHDVSPSWNAASTRSEIAALRKQVAQTRDQRLQSIPEQTDEWEVQGIAGKVNGSDNSSI